MSSRTALRRLTAAVAATIAFGAVTLVPGSPADAYGTPVKCKARSQSQVFAPWGDHNFYYRAPNGGFEKGSKNWQLSGGARVVEGNESYYVRRSTDTHSLSLPTGARAEGRTICTERVDRTVRFFIKDPQVAGAMLKINVEVESSRGRGVLQYWVGSGSFSRGWQPFHIIEIPATYGPDGRQNLTLSFEAIGSQATWQIDDVFVDPFKSI